MEDRYEIRAKIGQGGLGSVYKAFDVRMNREVAIKRIVTSSEDSSVPEEATRQLIKEAGALASLQHPNIVTIYDVGTDEDGPFVVMELLTGDTLDDIISQGSFTWQDFRQLAMQTLEALIAAQELHLVHRDLKPGNIMLTWLPSGKFQVKIVDFGLAKLSAKPSLQTIDQSDGVFGSIYFMAPEQFERVPIDHRTDLYAIGCVFYHALTGTYPFDGDNAAEVMASHLQHHVTPIQEVREGIPLWTCDWIMWHLNRQPDDRPESARQALQFFVENDSAHASPELSTGAPAPPVEQPKRPRLLIPGSAPTPEVVKEPSPTQPAKTASAPKALVPPQGSKPSVHTTAQVVQSARTEEAAAPTADSPPPEETQTADPAETETENEKPVETQALTPAAPVLKRATPTAKPAVVAAKPPLSTPPASTAPATAKEAAAPLAPSPHTGKKSLSNSAKTMIAVVLGILAVLLGVFMLQKSGKNAAAKLYNEMIQQAATDPEVPVSERKLEILLESAVDTGSNNDRANIYTALVKARATDGTDIDARIANFATTREMIPDVRKALIRDVLRLRKNPAVIGTLLDFAESTEEPGAAVAAIEASRFMATDSHFPDFLEVLVSAENDSIRKAAEETLANIITKSSSLAPIRSSLASAYDSASNDIVRHSILRLFGYAGGEKAIELAKANLASEDIKDKIAAIVALGNWTDQEGYQLLLDHIASETDLQLRDRAFKTALQYAGQSTENLQEIWTLLTAQAKTSAEQLALVRGLANVPPEPWNFAILQNFVDNSDNEDVADLADKAVLHLEDIRKVQGESSPDDEEDE